MIRLRCGACLLVLSNQLTHVQVELRFLNQVVHLEDIHAKPLEIASLASFFYSSKPLFFCLASQLFSFCSSSSLSSFLRSTALFDFGLNSPKLFHLCEVLLFLDNSENLIVWFLRFVNFISIVLGILGFHMKQILKICRFIRTSSLAFRRSR